MSRVDKALERYQRDQQRAEQSMEALYDAIAAAVDAGVRQVDLVKRTGYTREHIRRICDPQWRAQRRER